MSINESNFTINVTAASGENFAGAFKIRKRLSHMQNLRRDEIRRSLLGTFPEFAPESVHTNAYMLSTCSVYVIDAPRWWKESNNGLDLLDPEPVAEVFSAIQKVIEASTKELAQKSEQATEVLKAEVK